MGKLKVDAPEVLNLYFSDIGTLTLSVGGEALAPHLIDVRLEVISGHYPRIIVETYPEEACKGAGYTEERLIDLHNTIERLKKCAFVTVRPRPE